MSKIEHVQRYDKDEQYVTSPENRHKIGCPSHLLGSTYNRHIELMERESVAM